MKFTIKKISILFIPLTIQDFNILENICVAYNVGMVNRFVQFKLII